jgi:hypothetical protein
VPQPVDEWSMGASVSQLTRSLWVAVEFMVTDAFYY